MANRLRWLRFVELSSALTLVSRMPPATVNHNSRPRWHGVSICGAPLVLGAARGSASTLSSNLHSHCPWLQEKVEGRCGREGRRRLHRDGQRRRRDELGKLAVPAPSASAPVRPLIYSTVADSCLPAIFGPARHRLRRLRASGAVSRERKPERRRSGSGYACLLYAEASGTGVKGRPCLKFAAAAPSYEQPLAQAGST
jgi:hypothetical protein